MNTEKKYGAIRLAALACALLCALSFSGCGCRSERDVSEVSADSSITTTTSQTTTTTTKETLTLTKADCLCVGISLAVYDYTAAFAKEDEALHEAVAAALSDLYDDGTVDAISDRWFHETVFPRDGVTVAEPTATDDSWSRVKAAGTWTVGADADAFPLSFREADGKWSGYEVDIVRAVSERLGVDVQFQAVSEDDRYEALQKGQVTALWGGCRYDSDYRRQVLYAAQSEWMLEDTVCYYTKKDDVFSGETELWAMKETMVTESGSFSERFMQERLRDEAVNLTVLSMDSAEDCFLALQDGTAFAVAIDSLSAAYWLQ